MEYEAMGVDLLASICAELGILWGESETPEEIRVKVIQDRCDFYFSEGAYTRSDIHKKPTDIRYTRMPRKEAILSDQNNSEWEQ